MPKRITYRERSHSRGWNTRFMLDRERTKRWLRRHLRHGREPLLERPWWWRLANR